MKKIILTLVVLTIVSNANYEIFKSQTQSIGTPIKIEELFFGPYTDFAHMLVKGTNKALTNGLISGITGGLTSGGINAVIGFLDPFIMSLYADQKYLRILKLTDAKGNVAFKKVLFVRDKHPSYSDEKIHQLIK